jgi:hypothetical protein
LKPGKESYRLPELNNNYFWDAYKQDCYALGVILFCMLTGMAPYKCTADTDPWFHVIYSGAWLTQAVRLQDAAAIYTHIDDDALLLIDKLIKPQHLIPTADQILTYAFLSC